MANTVTCKTCNTGYTDASFLAAHPGPFSSQALQYAKLYPVHNCAGCPTYTISKLRPPVGKL